MRVCINPGHHPVHDSGAVGPGGLREADVTTRLARALVARLEALPGIEAYAKRQVGGPHTLDELCDRVNASKPALFISLHCNASLNAAAQGPQVLVPLRSADRRHKAIARLLLARLPGSESRWSRVIGAQVLVLRRMRAVRVLVEADFISHPEVEARMHSEAWEERVAEACARAVERSRAMMNYE